MPRGVYDRSKAKPRKLRGEGYRPTFDRPWLEVEKIKVDGLRLVYRFVHGEMRVCMPGCKTETLEELRARGATIVMPTHLRK